MADASTMAPLTIAVLGEALVDRFSDIQVAGGAPFNVARSLAGLGVPTVMVSRIGQGDADGQVVKASAEAFGVSLAGVQIDAAHATGAVTVSEHDGSHRFHIHDDAAWDHIELDQAVATLQRRPAQWLYFGTLAQRGAASQATLRAVLKQTPARRFLDLNLRPVADLKHLAAESLMLADWLKINEDELAQLLAWFAPQQHAIGSLMRRFALQRLVVTRGAAGWALYDEGGGCLHAGAGAPQARLVDTVGAGDAFSALLLAGLAHGRDLPQTLALANRYAAFVCGVRGPLPAQPDALAPWREALLALAPAA